MKLTVDYLQKQFNIYNNRFFDGALPHIRIELSKTKRSLGRFWHIDNKTPIKIDISIYYNRSMSDINNTLIHEMIHYYICFMGMKDSSAHGYIFKSMAKHISDNSEFDITIKSKVDLQNIRVRKKYKLMRFTINKKACIARVCSKFDPEYFINSYGLSDVKLIYSDATIFDTFTECRTNLKYKYITNAISDILSVK